MKVWIITTGNLDYDVFGHIAAVYDSEEKAKAYLDRQVPKPEPNPKRHNRWIKSFFIPNHHVRTDIFINIEEHEVE